MPDRPNSLAFQRRRRSRSFVALVLLVLGCQYPATETLVTMDTDAPLDRTLTITITVTGASMGTPDASSTRSSRVAVRAAEFNFRGRSPSYPMAP